MTFGSSFHPQGLKIAFGILNITCCKHKETKEHLSSSSQFELAIPASLLASAHLCCLSHLWSPSYHETWVLSPEPHGSQTTSGSDPQHSHESHNILQFHNRMQQDRDTCHRVNCVCSLHKRPVLLTQRVAMPPKLTQRDKPAASISGCVFLLVSQPQQNTCKTPHCKGDSRESMYT